MSAGMNAALKHMHTLSQQKAIDEEERKLLDEIYRIES
jgi:hypothetical protein